MVEKALGAKDPMTESLSDNLLLLCLLRSYQQGGSMSERKRGDFSKCPLSCSEALHSYFSSVNCYRETFLKVGNKAIYLEAGHTVVHVESCVLEIQIRLKTSLVVIIIITCFSSSASGKILIA